MNYIHYQAQKLPAKFSYRVIKSIKDQYGIDLSGASEALTNWITDQSNQEVLFFEMLKEGYRQEKKENPYTVADMLDILSTDHAYADFLKIYQTDAILFVTPSVNGQVKPEDKKKAVQV